MLDRLRNLTPTQKTRLAFILLFIVVVSSITAVFLIDSSPKQKQVYNLKKSEQRQYSESTVSSSKELPKDATPQEQAQATLETEKIVTDSGKIDSFKKDLETALNFIKDTKGTDIEPDYAHNLSLNTPSTLRTFKAMFDNGYSVDPNTIKVYESYNDNVVQYTFDLKKDGGNTVTIAGNYAVNTKQVELVQIKGVPTGLAN